MDSIAPISSGTHETEEKKTKKKLGAGKNIMRKKLQEISTRYPIPPINRFAPKGIHKTILSTLQQDPLSLSTVSARSNSILAHLGNIKICYVKTASLFHVMFKTLPRTHKITFDIVYNHKPFSYP